MVGYIDLQNAIHPRQYEDDATVGGDGAPAQIRSSASGHQGNTVLIRQAYDPGHLVGVSGEDHDLGFSSAERSVVRVRKKILRGVQDMNVSDDAAKAIYDASIHPALPLKLYIPCNKG
jgi:hypothetical protein